MVAIEEMTMQEVIGEVEAIKYMSDGNIHIFVPRLIEQMTKPDRVQILEWHVKEGDIVQPDTLMLTADFLQDDWYFPIPPLGNSLRVIRIEASVGDIVHLDDPLIVLKPVRDTI
jgi:hypothetical protein